MWKNLFFVSFFALASFCMRLDAQAQMADSATVFARKCSSCHTVGGGVLVGPDLENVTERRDRSWLVPFIRSPRAVIASGDPTALALLEKHNREVMPDHDLSEDQIHGLLDLIEGGGPATARAFRPASQAHRAEIERGRALFLGTARLTCQGIACASCHPVATGGRLRGGALAPDLTRAHSKHADELLARKLSRPCFPRRLGGGKAIYLNDEETYALRAFLYQTNKEAGPAAGQTMQASLAGRFQRFPHLGPAILVFLGVVGGSLWKSARKGR